MELEGKRLLYIGGKVAIKEIADYTNAHGIHLLAAGEEISEEVEKLTEEQYEIEVSNKEALYKVVIEHNIDGILVIGNEDIISCVVEIAENLNIQFYVNKTQWNELQNKKNFKKNCQLYDIPVVDSYKIDNEEDVDRLPGYVFPVVLKPADSCGSKGISICNSKDELLHAIQKAQLFSRTGTFLCEKYMECPEITIKYLFEDGKIYLWEVNDRYVNREQKGVGAIANATVYPSKYLQLYENTLHNKIVKMLKDYKLYNGTMFIQAFVDNDIIRPYDPGLRISGGMSQFITTHVFGVNPIEFMINVALVGKMELSKNRNITKIRPDMNGHYLANYSILVKSGTIAEIGGMDIVKKMPEVFKIIQLLHIGDSISMVGTLQQVFARVQIEADTRERLNEIMLEIYDTVKIIGENGENLKLHQTIDII